MNRDPRAERTSTRRVALMKRCPSCRTRLDGGPIRYRCWLCGTAVTAADIDREYHPEVA